MNLLEECWFFDNLLNIRPKMLRSHSDPYPSMSSDFLVKDSNVSTNSSPSKQSNNSTFVHSKKMQRTPSLPPIRVRKEEDYDDKKGSNSSKLVHQPLDYVVFQASSSKPHCAQMKGHHHGNRRKSKLLRTPSLPPSIGREEKFQEIDPRIGRSCKQPSTPTNIDKLPPRLTSK
ncbi:hypothetical protein A2U01_0033213, partial [Trifolium medium]|nr:hypothetical protein [Trifolium medium]